MAITDFIQMPIVPCHALIWLIYFSEYRGLQVSKFFCKFPGLLVKCLGSFQIPRTVIFYRYTRFSQVPRFLNFPRYPVHRSPTPPPHVFGKPRCSSKENSVARIGLEISDEFFHIPGSLGFLGRSNVTRRVSRFLGLHVSLHLVSPYVFRSPSKPSGLIYSPDMQVSRVHQSENLTPTI